MTFFSPDSARAIASQAAYDVLKAIAIAAWAVTLNPLAKWIAKTYGFSWSGSVGWLIAGSLVLFLIGVVLVDTAKARRLKGTGSRVDHVPVDEGAAHKLVIHSALYGTSPQNDVDVTHVLQKQAKDGLVIAIENEVMGRDPIYGQVKRLEVEYS